jgi:hypothetical protein
VSAIVDVLTKRLMQRDTSWKIAAAGAGLLAVVLTACKTAPPALPPAPPQQVETGSTITLLSPLTFPASQSQLFFQDGRMVGASAISPRSPYCKLVPHAGAPHSLLPGPLTVGGVSYDERESGTGSAMFSITRITLLTSPSQPGYTMSCGWSAARASPEFVSTEQIDNAIRGQFTMQLRR